MGDGGLLHSEAMRGVWRFWRQMLLHGNEQAVNGGCQVIKELRLVQRLGEPLCVDQGHASYPRPERRGFTALSDKILRNVSLIEIFIQSSHAVSLILIYFSG